jgi:hypothetical protein
MFHDAFAVELGRAGAPIDEVSLSLGRSSVKLTEHSAQARRMDAAWTRPGHDPDTTWTRPGCGAGNTPSPRPASE